MCHRGQEENGTFLFGTAGRILSQVYSFSGQKVGSHAKSILIQNSRYVLVPSVLCFLNHQVGSRTKFIIIPNSMQDLMQSNGCIIRAVSNYMYGLIANLEFISSFRSQY